MKGQAKTHTMRLYTSGTVDKETGKKIADFSFRYSLSKVWEGCTTNAEYRTAAINAQQQLRKLAEVQTDDGERTHSDSHLSTVANAITFQSVDPNTDFKRGKTDVERFLDIHNRMTPEERVEAGKLIKAQDKETKAA